MLGDHSLRAAIRTVFQMASHQPVQDFQTTPTPVTEAVMSRDWQPFMAASYGLLAMASLWFLAAGFTVFHQLVGTLTVGSGPIAVVLSFLVLVTVVAVACRPIAKQQLGKIDSDPHVRQHLLWVVGISAMLLLPLTQHMTFGSMPHG